MKKINSIFIAIFMLFASNAILFTDFREPVSATDIGEHDVEDGVTTGHFDFDEISSKYNSGSGDLENVLVVNNTEIILLSDEIYTYSFDGSSFTLENTSADVNARRGFYDGTTLYVSSDNLFKAYRYTDPG